MIRYWLLIVTITLPLPGCFDVSCGKDDPKAVAARALSKARLQQLYADAEHIIRSESQDRLGDQFRDIAHVKIRVDAGEFRSRPKIVSLMLKGCFDHYIYLDVTSIGTEDARIELRYGEGPTAGREVLWRRVDG